MEFSLIKLNKMSFGFFLGPDCSLPLSIGQVGPIIDGSSSSGPSREFSAPADSGHGGGTDPGTIAGIVIVLFLGALIIGIMVYYKFYLRFKRLKTELAHVHYIADPGTNPGMIVAVQNHFIIGKIRHFFYFRHSMNFCKNAKLTRGVLETVTTDRRSKHLGRLLVKLNCN